MLWKHGYDAGLCDLCGVLKLDNLPIRILYFYMMQTVIIKKTDIESLKIIELHSSIMGVSYAHELHSSSDDPQRAQRAVNLIHHRLPSTGSEFGNSQVMRTRPPRHYHLGGAPKGNSARWCVRQGSIINKDVHPLIKHGFKTAMAFIYKRYPQIPNPFFGDVELDAPQGRLTEVRFIPKTKP